MGKTKLFWRRCVTLGENQTVLTTVCYTCGKLNCSDDGVLHMGKTKLFWRQCVTLGNTYTFLTTVHYAYECNVSGYLPSSRSPARSIQPLRNLNCWRPQAYVWGSTRCFGSYRKIYCRSLAILSVNSMSTYMHVGSGTGGTLRVKSRGRHGVFGSLFGNNLRSSWSSQFSSIAHAELQL